MNSSFRYGVPNEAIPIVQELQSRLDSKDDEWHVLSNLFDSDRIEWADEAVFLKSDIGEILALGLICKSHPFIVSYYTFPTYRCNGYGYLILRSCISRITESNPQAPICIEPTSETVHNHIARLPDEARLKLIIR